MINDFKKIIQEGIVKKDVSYFGKKSKEMLKIYNINEKTLYNRFKSIYGKSPREVISENIFPSENQMIEFILNSKTSEEVRFKTGLSQRYFIGIYDKYFKVSTFKESKLKILNKKLNISYNPNIFDNRALIASQILGDGSYDKKRHSITITHGEKQIEYLKFKVSLFTKAFPKFLSKITINNHIQGHIYGRWYSGNIGHYKPPVYRKDLVKELTPLGWLLYYMDDGCFNQDITIAIKDEEVALSLIHELKTYNIYFRRSKDIIIACGNENSLLFYKNFIEPFKGIIPKCMQYKVDDIVEKCIII